MNKFLIYIKTRFVWLLYFALLFFIEYLLACTFLDICFLNCVEDYVSIFPLTLYNSTLPIVPQLIVSYIFLRLVTNLMLWVYSYKLYVGKNNWYKFYKVTDKVYKKFNRVLYDEYRNGYLDINNFDAHNIDFNSIVNKSDKS